uniref:Uncharacterized protein n=1 Tax=Onchocerca volvulus TaxID=6282 RepID=A0A8R1Y1R1_ONCVO
MNEILCPLAMDSSYQLDIFLIIVLFDGTKIVAFYICLKNIAYSFLFISHI